MSDYDDGGDYGQRYNRNEWRSGNPDEGWGAADAEDFYDSGAAEDLPIEHHAAGMSYDPYYDQQYMGPGVQPDLYNPYNPYPPNVPLPPGAAPVPPPGAVNELPDSAQRLRGRFMRHNAPTSRKGKSADGIDSLFDMGLGDFRIGMPGFLPCSPILFVLLVLILLFGCIGMGVLAANGLSDLVNGF